LHGSVALFDGQRSSLDRSITSGRESALLNSYGSLLGSDGPLLNYLSSLLNCAPLRGV
jgi:hypothetical protein